MQGKSAFPDDHPLALGSANRTAPKGVFKWLGASDTILCIGSGLTRTNFGIDIPPGKFMIHSNVNVEDINKDYGIDIGLVGDARLTLELMIDEVKAAVGDNGRETNTALAADIAATKASGLRNGRRSSTPTKRRSIPIGSSTKSTRPSITPRAW